MRWQWEIKPDSAWFEWNGKELWHYRHLLLRLIRRDFLTQYQQTLLGPVWVVIQPLVTVLLYVVIFDRVVGISTDHAPPVLFYLSGIILWNLFAESFSGSVYTFSANAPLFSKVYFPRLIIPLSVTATHIIRFFIQFALFLGIYVFYIYKGIVSFHPLYSILALTLGVVVPAGLGLGAGLALSVFLAKYRDLTNLIQLTIRLLMFATPVIYPLSIVPETIRRGMILNPLTPVVEFFRFAFLGEGMFSILQLGYSLGCVAAIFIFGAVLFNKMSAKLIDVV
ncbi:MAG TPA: ABC transporter permease [Ohtaekwangia sp.]